MKFLLTDLNIPLSGPMKLYCGNKFAINLMYNPTQHDHTKHVEVDRHYIKEKLESKVIYTLSMFTQDPLVDLQTKGVF